jgi:hypothetical protein
MAPKPRGRSASTFPVPNYGFAAFAGAVVDLATAVLLAVVFAVPVVVATLVLEAALLATIGPVVLPIRQTV